jgi:hypothetical protein
LPAGEGFEQGVDIRGLVVDQSRRTGVLDQWLCTSEIAGLTWRRRQLHGIAQGIDERVDLVRSATRSADRLLAIFLERAGTMFVLMADIAAKVLAALLAPPKVRKRPSRDLGRRHVDRSLGLNQNVKPKDGSGARRRKAGRARLNENRRSNWLQAPKQGSVPRARRRRSRHAALF